MTKKTITIVLEHFYDCPLVAPFMTDGHKVTYIPPKPTTSHTYTYPHTQVEKPLMKLQKLYFEGPSSSDKRRAAQLAARQSGAGGRVELVAASKGTAM